jgi:lysophospholipid acyltransferase (LPLAT)-like uncharacterized protein
MGASNPRLSMGDRLLVNLVGTLGPIVVRLLGATWRVRVANPELLESVRERSSGIVFAFWHGQLLPLEYIYRGLNVQVLSSWHRDGEMSARLMTALGYGVVRGSPSRGSARGLMGMLAKAVDGLDLAITPDGPRGPARTVKRGIFYLAEKSGSPIVPVGVAASRARRLSSWDRFVVPLPFSRVAVVYGDPIAPDREAPFDEKAADLAGRLDALTEEAERVARGL